MERKELKSTKNVFLKIDHVDNTLIALMNNEELYAESVENDPYLGLMLNLSPYLKAGNNILRLYGLNHGGPSHFSFKVIEDGYTVIDVDKRYSANGLVDKWAYNFNIG